MSSADARKESEFALAKPYLGTGALSASSLFDVKGWVCVVTGGGTGLGLVTAAALAENGAKVYITGRRLETLEAAAKTAAPKGGSGKIIPIQADAATKEGAQKMRDAVAKEENWVNLLVNNHGVSIPHGEPDSTDNSPEALSKEMFENETYEHWLDAYRINTASYYFSTWAFVPLLCSAKTKGGAQEVGNVVNISSMSGITRTSQRGQFSYNCSKAATISLTDQLAFELARRGLNIRVNTICPGYFPSGMSVFPPDTIDNHAAHAKEWREKWGVPFGRAGNARDYAQCIFGVVTNAYQTGAHVVIDGGWLLEQAF
ncbi:NAD(P)-binding protein [Cutaneotrichosporon oleaginosum]|uniref:NAD(P)-binding protein n=1 Tax=Cutaneotrichosporon oleaginosum TaxID=879819 RepID=A0A0J1BEI7_9TREE|nr:NAD(P)-binding protein [Cutaneotrichosporon oleaginosum]KLT46529.1 NAD(P)-binding protein [Cutaneotrichosporon oleaginosum]